MSNAIWPYFEIGGLWDCIVDKEVIRLIRL
jgi:hypothetical protein